MRKEEAKKATIEVIEGVQCILDAQLGVKNKTECIPVLKRPVHRFCEIAKKTEKKVQKRDSTYDISRFLGGHISDRRKMGFVCSEETNFPSCDKGVLAKSWEEETKYRKPCAKEVVAAIKTKPIENTENWSKMLNSFENMRDWMHISGYATPDYVWVVPGKIRSQVKSVFDYLASEKIRSTKDLKKLAEEVEKW